MNRETLRLLTMIGAVAFPDSVQHDPRAPWCIRCHEPMVRPSAQDEYMCMNITCGIKNIFE